ncbi:hypothetical protein GGR52DRAFT_420025 [Hypoxylon sp. FL1284]|nr:hypothetical protein GGR52DRAFT_420025 [Hypoxylon sp. FL1284]
MVRHSESNATQHAISNPATAVAYIHWCSVGRDERLTACGVHVVRGESRERNESLLAQLRMLSQPLVPRALTFTFRSTAMIETGHNLLSPALALLSCPFRDPVQQTELPRSSLLPKTNHPHFYINTQYPFDSPRIKKTVSQGPKTKTSYPLAAKAYLLREQQSNMCFRNYKQAWCDHGRHSYGTKELHGEIACMEVRRSNTLAVGECEQGIVNNSYVVRDPIVDKCVICKEMELAQTNGDPDAYDDDDDDDDDDDIRGSQS